MKKLILMLTFAALATAIFGQSYTVVDTVYVKNTKWQIVNEGVDRIEKNLTTVFDREKVSTDTMLYLSESRQLLTAYRNLLAKYIDLFMEVDTLQFTKIDNDYYLNADKNNKGIIKEYQELNMRIEKLKSDPDIKYIDAVEKFKQMKARQTVLKKRYNLIQSK